MTGPDHVHSVTDHGPTSLGGTWQLCACGQLTTTEPDGQVTVTQYPPVPPKD